VQAKLYSPPAPSFLLEGDKTLPDLVFDELADTWGAVIVVNSSTTVTTDLALAVHGDQLNRVVTPLPSIPPLSIRKVGFRIQAHPLDPDVKTIDGHLELLHGPDDTPLHTVPLSLRVRETYAARKRTFLSDIDGSVQYYALRRAVPRSEDDPPPALVLSCHGAGVEGIGQAAAYSSKSWLHLVAPTNRRPYGFDWEDVGRADAMEVLRIAKASLRHDPARIYLTGHSMGGHGTWHLGSLYPDTFAAIGPSAGWISYRGYARRGTDADDGSPVKDLLRRGEKIGDPTELAVNLKHHGIYVLHGGADRNVPVNQAESMAELLGNMHRDWSYHEEPGKGHWWSNELDDGGATCMDWPPMYDCFARHTIPPAAAVRHVEFATANPGVSNRCYWVSIEGQLRHQDVSRVNLHTWPNKRRFQGTTENVAVLGLDVGHLMSTGPITIDLDGQHLEKIADPEDGKMLWLRNVAGDWRLTEKPLPLQKGPHRYGAIKNELRNRFVFVYGTRGTEEENKWMFAKARLDGETFWYRGNGSIDMIADAEFDPDEYADRTIVVYGNAETNSAWHNLLKECPVHVQRDRITLGEQTITGDDLAVLFVQPRRDSDTAAVIVIAGTGPTGMRLACKQSLFVPFIRYPDCVVLSTQGLEAGSATVELAGYFGLDWSVENGEFLWHEDP